MQDKILIQLVNGKKLYTNKTNVVMIESMEKIKNPNFPDAKSFVHVNGKNGMQQFLCQDSQNKILGNLNSLNSISFNYLIEDCIEKCIVLNKNAIETVQEAEEDGKEFTLVSVNYFDDQTRVYKSTDNAMHFVEKIENKAPLILDENIIEV